jgi:hypothetical protein
MMVFAVAGGMLILRAPAVRQRVSPEPQNGIG